MPPYLSDRPKPRIRRQRKLPWPATRLTDLHHAVQAMAELSGVSVTVFIRAAVIRHLAWIHAQEFPGIDSPWDDEAGIEPRAMRRVAEGEG